MKDKTNNIMKTQQFRGKTLTRTKTINNILRVYNKTTTQERYNWYKEANEFCQSLSEIYNLDNSKVIGILSALSPLKTWEQNKKITEDLIVNKDCGQMRVFVGKSLAILEAETSDDNILKILNGKKISAFYLNIKYPDTSDRITIDRHALSIALGYKIKDEEYTMTKLQYKFFVHCYKIASEKVNISPLIMQSSTWLIFRKNN